MPQLSTRRFRRCTPAGNNPKHPAPLNDPDGCPTIYENESVNPAKRFFLWISDFVEGGGAAQRLTSIS